MKNISQPTNFSSVRPNHFFECFSCPIASERIEAERINGMKEYGQLEIHRVTIDCHNDFGRSETMWAIHYGHRSPTESELGFLVEKGMISGGSWVDCPGLKK